MKKISITFLIPLLIFSCTPQRKLVYFQGNFSSLSDSASTGYFKLKIIPGDILLVNVFTINQEAFPYFNSTTDKTGSDTRSPYEKGFVVSEKGTVQLPLIGEVRVQDMTMAEAADTIKEKLKYFVEEPIVAVKKLNFKITVLGEVAHPGSFPIYSESVTLPEALGLAGDITSFGNKTILKIIRSDNKTPRVLMVDMTNAATLTPENYFLHPDDIVYVEPVRRKALQNINPAITLITSLLTTAVVVVSLLIK